MEAVFQGSHEMKGAYSKKRPLSERGTKKITIVAASRTEKSPLSHFDTFLRIGKEEEEEGKKEIENARSTIKDTTTKANSTFCSSSSSSLDSHFYFFCGGGPSFQLCVINQGVEKKKRGRNLASIFCSAADFQNAVQR